jgi:hypothetical protein
MAWAANHARALQELVAQRTVFRNVGGVDCPEYPALIVMRVKTHGPCQAWERNCRSDDLAFSTWALHENEGALVLPWGELNYRSDATAKHRFTIRPGLAIGRTHQTVSSCNPAERQERQGTPCERARQRETATEGVYSTRLWNQRGRFGIGHSGGMDVAMTFDAASSTLTYREYLFEPPATCRFVPDTTVEVSEGALAKLGR